MDHGQNQRIAELCHWVYRLAYLNMLWLGFALAGVVVFGFWPATAAMFRVTRKWITGETELPLFQVFRAAVFSEFWPAQRIGLAVTAAGIILYINISVYLIAEGSIGGWPKVLAILLAAQYLVIAGFLFPCYSHVKLPFWRYFLQAWLLGYVKPGMTLWMMGGALLLTEAVTKYPPLFLFFGGSSIALWTTWCAHRVFAGMADRSDAAAETKN